MVCRLCISSFAFFSALRSSYQPRAAAMNNPAGCVNIAIEPSNTKSRDVRRTLSLDPLGRSCKSHVYAICRLGDEDSRCHTELCACPKPSSLGIVSLRQTNLHEFHTSSQLVQFFLSRLACKCVWLPCNEFFSSRTALPNGK